MVLTQDHLTFVMDLFWRRLQPDYTLAILGNRVILALLEPYMAFMSALV